MNPQYMPQQPYGAPPQNFAPMKQGSDMSQPGQNMSFNDQNAASQSQGPYGYKGPMNQPLAQNNMRPPMQPGMPPMSHISSSSLPPQGQFAPPHHLNGPPMGQPAQFQNQIRSPNLNQTSPRPSFNALSQGQLTPRQMVPPPAQMPPQSNQLGEVDLSSKPQQNNMPPSPSQSESSQNASQVPPPMGPPQGHMNSPPRPQMNSVNQQMQPGAPPATISQPNSFGPPKTMPSAPGPFPGMGQPRMGLPPPISQPGQQPMGYPPLSQPNMAPPPMGIPPMMPRPMSQPMGQPPIGQPPMGQPPMGQPPLGQPPLNQPPIGQPPMGQPPMGQPPMGQPPMGQPPMGQPPMGQPPMGQPPMGPPVAQYSPSPSFMPPTSMGPSQLASQMQGMQIGGQRQYPGTPMKPAINGDNSPHMPPPLSQSQGQYINGSQARSPQQPMGYPPMPSQQQMPAGPYSPQPGYQQPQQVRRLDPDQMPSPIQVTQDDQRTRSGIFCTNQKGLVPPLVSTNFITQDQGNASPRFIRATMYNVPTTSDMMKQTAVPFGLVISPLARTVDQEYPPPVVDFGELGPVRCIRCKAYMCPYMQFIDSGRRFQCLFCKGTTEVPAEYFQHLDHTGLRVDRFERPELILGTYEFVATKDYCRNNTFPKPPAIVFVIDVSYNNMKSGLVHLLCSQMKSILQNLPIDNGQEKSRMKVGFITYNNTVHFYNIKGSLAQPQMMVVGDTHEMFMPLLDGFLCDVEESSAVIDSLMEQIPAMFADNRDTEVILLPAIQAGLEALKASECAGKLLVFHSTLPTAEAPGRLKNRDDRKLLGTEKERTVLVPQTQAYNQLGQDCVGVGCSVDLFIFNNSYIDVSTIGQISRLTGGEVFKYTYFQADVDGKRLISDVITDISRPIAFDTIMRVRTSTGVRPTEFYGHFYMSNTTDMEIASIDCDKAVAVEIKHDDKLTEEDGVYIQVALLYTSCAGQRRLRIINLSLKTCSQMADLYRSCELDTIVNFFAKQSVYRLLENNPKAVKDSLVNRCAQILACYRKNCANPSSAGQLILPECMKLLPLYVNCLLKSDALSGGSDMTLDDRAFVMQAVTIMDIPTSVVYFYPKLIPLHEIPVTAENPEIPNAVRCTVEKMTDNGIYLLENGIHMLMWIGSNASPEWIQNVFGVTTATQVDTERFELPLIENNLSLTIRNLVEQVQIQRHRCMRLTLVKQRDKLEIVFRHFLVEDRGNDGTSSYVDFLCHMHKEIRQLLS